MPKWTSNVIVDYLQLMQPTTRSRGDNRVQEIGDIFRSLKFANLARSM